MSEHENKRDPLNRELIEIARTNGYASIGDDGVIRCTLLYPRTGGPFAVEVDISETRASDGIRIEYDFARDGYVIMQPTKLSGRADEDPEEGWREVAFVQSWHFIDEQKKNDERP